MKSLKEKVKDKLVKQDQSLQIVHMLCRPRPLYNDLNKDPYEAIRQTYLVEMDTESEPYEDPIDTKTPESPHAVASPTLLPDSTPLACHTEESEDSDTFGERSTSSDSTVPLSPDHLLARTSPTLTPTRASFHRRTARMTVRAQPITSLGHSAKVAEAMALSDSALCKSEEDEIGEEDTNEDEGHGLDDEGRRVESGELGLEGDEETVPEGQQRTTPVCRNSCGSVPESERPKRVSALRLPTLTTRMDPKDAPSAVPSPISSPMISLTVPSPTPKATIPRPVLALEAWAGHVDTRMADMSRAGYDDHRLVHDMLVQQAALHRKLQEMRGRVTALEQERGRREQSFGESKETPLEETDSLEGPCIELGNGTSLWRISVEKFELNFGDEIPLRGLDCDN
nr:hypothetical protein [Tanacetum cinerariifolium]